MVKPLIALGAAVAAIGLAAAGASAAGTPSPSPRPQPKQSAPATPSTQPSGQSQEQEPPDDQGGVHGGPVARFHGDATQACNLTDISKLTGNWTHGDYVTAVAAADATKAAQAAHSPCGKPAHAAGKGKGPKGPK